MKKTGILVINLGGPEKIEDVKPFLFNLFSDPEIIRVPITALQKPLAWFISTTRKKKSEGYYRQIGGGSPQRRITNEQAGQLSNELKSQGYEVNVYVGMMCWHPFLTDTLQKIIQDQITHLIILPLFPHFSITTTGSAAKKLIAFFDQNAGLRNIKRSYITHYEDQPAYITLLAQMILQKTKEFSDPNLESTKLLFSAHSIPVSYVKRGDPYLKQTQKTVSSVVKQIEIISGKQANYILSFQSKIGPVKWLEPSTDSTIRQLGESKEKQVLAIPISFVSEHIETLYEMDILYKNLAKEVGIKEFKRIATPNCEPLFIQALTELTKKHLKFPTST